MRRPTPPRVPPQELAVRRYAVHLRPVVDRASHAFDTAVRQAASSGGLSALAASCARSVTAIGVQEDYIEGVPHPYAWYTKAGLLHHQILGIYHRMEGSAVSCHTTAANNDRKAASTAISDMSAAARHLHRVAAQIRALTRLPH